MLQSGHRAPTPGDDRTVVIKRDRHWDDQVENGSLTGTIFLVTAANFQLRVMPRPCLIRAPPNNHRARTRRRSLQRLRLIPRRAPSSRALACSGSPACFRISHDTTLEDCATWSDFAPVRLRLTFSDVSNIEQRLRTRGCMLVLSLRSPRHLPATESVVFPLLDQGAQLCCALNSTNCEPGSAEGSSSMRPLKSSPIPVRFFTLKPKHFSNRDGLSRFLDPFAEYALR